MYVFNRWYEQTGTIIYENTQELVSGLITYDTPYILQTGTTFSVVSRRRFIKKSDETHRSINDELIVQFGENEIYNLNNTGIQIMEGATKLLYDGVNFRAVNVNNFGESFSRYMPVGITEVKFLRETPLAT